jgi:hypothetical protein
MTDRYEALYYRLVAERQIRDGAQLNGGELEYALGDLCPS